MAMYKWNSRTGSVRLEVSQIFDDLDKYRAFCVAYGRSFNEADLYSDRSRDYQDFLRYREGGYANNHWNWNRDKDKDKDRRPARAGGYNNDSTSNRTYQHTRSPR